MLLSRHQNAGQNHDIKIGNMFWKCGTVEIFQFNSICIYLRANLTAQRPVTKLARVHRNTQNN
jgi:hypothetical protein